MRAVLYQGYWLVASLYFVVVAHLSSFELVFLGTIMGATLLLSDIPTGAWSDAIGRKWPLVIGHISIGAGMVLTGVGRTFPVIAAGTVLWGLGWGFSNGIDSAWITDELNQPHRISQVLTAGARWNLAGAATGMIVFGTLGWATSLSTAILTSGVAMVILGLFVARRFTEHNFTPVRHDRWRASVSIFRRGLTQARRDHEIMLVLVATMIINGASEISRLFPKQLVDLGFPSDAVLWYTALGVLTLTLGVLAIRIVETRIGGAGGTRRTYALCCVVGLLGLVVLTLAPDALVGSAGVLLVSGITFNVTRVVSVIWLNRRVTSDVRATMHSFLSQAESLGEVFCGVGLAVLAQTVGISAALLTSGGLVACAGVIVARSKTADR
jgi:MFS family permease